MYTTTNFKTKKSLKEAVAEGKKIAVKNLYNNQLLESGKAVVEGPWYPEPHKWYAEVVIENGFIVRVK